MVRHWLLALLASLLFIPSAQARVLPDHQVEQARSIALQTWGDQFRCSTGANIVWEDLRGDRIGEARWWYYRNNPTAYSDCKVGIDVHYDWDFEWLCTIMVHEYGHLSGQEHSENPRSVMHAYVVRVFPACRITNKSRRVKRKYRA